MVHQKRFSALIQHAKETWPEVKTDIERLQNLKDDAEKRRLSELRLNNAAQRQKEADRLASSFRELVSRPTDSRGDAKSIFSPVHKCTYTYRD